MDARWPQVQGRAGPLCHSFAYFLLTVGSCSGHCDLISFYRPLILKKMVVTNPYRLCPQTSTCEEGDTVRWWESWPGTWEGQEGMRYLLNVFVPQALFYGYYSSILHSSLKYSLHTRKLRLRGLKHTQARSVYFQLRVEGESWPSVWQCCYWSQMSGRFQGSHI